MVRVLVPAKPILPNLSQQVSSMFGGMLRHMRIFHQMRRFVVVKCCREVAGGGSVPFLHDALADVS